MAGAQTSFSDDERDRLRAALIEHAAHFDLSPQQLADRIAGTTNFALAIDGGRKRVERFLKDTNRQTDDFIGAIADYLGTVPPPDIEQSAAILAHFFSPKVLKPSNMDELIGRYYVYASSDRRTYKAEGFSEHTTMNAWGEFQAPPPKPLSSKTAYALIEMKPLPKSDALLVSEFIFNFSANPEIDRFPDELLRERDAGVIVAFGHSDRDFPRYFMATRTVLESRLYRLYKVADDPLTLRGELNFNGGIGRTYHRTHSDPLHSDYEIELVKVTDETDD